MSGRRAAGAYAVLAVALGYVLSVATNLATSAVPSSWHWAHNGALLWSVVGVLAAAGVAVAIAQFRSSPGPTVPAVPRDASIAGGTVNLTDSIQQGGTVNLGDIASPGAVFHSTFVSMPRGLPRPVGGR